MEQEKCSIIVRENEFIKPDIHKTGNMFDTCTRDRHNKRFHTFKYRCMYDNKLTNFGNNEIFNLTIFDKVMNLQGLILKNAQESGFVFNPKNKLPLGKYSNLRNMNICYYIKLQIPTMQRQFFGIISQKPAYANNFCNDLNKPFYFACCQCVSYNQTN